MTESSLPLRHYIDVLRRQWWVIVVVAGVAIVVAALIAATSYQAEYRASMKMVVGQGGSVLQPQYGANVQPFTQTMTSLAESDVVASTVIEDLGLKITPRQLLNRLRVTSRPESAVLDMSYRASTRQTAVRVLSEVGSVFARLVEQRLGNRPQTDANGRTVPPITATVFDPAHIQPGTVGNSPGKTMGIAAVLGILLGIVLAFLRDALDDRIRSATDAERAYRAPVIGSVPRGLGERRLAGLHGVSRSRRLRPEVVDALYLLRANLQFAENGPARRVIAVTSGMPREGKTAVAANLATTLALSGHEVLLVDADLRRPALWSYLGIPPGPGLVDVYLDDVPLAETVVEVPLGHGLTGLIDPDDPRFQDAFEAGSENGDGPGDGVPDAGRLQVIPSGTIARAAGDILSVERVSSIVESVGRKADYVIFDASPVLTFGDAFPVLRAADQILVVARQDRSKQADAESVRTTLGRLGVDDVSVVLLGGAKSPPGRRMNDLFPTTA